MSQKSAELPSILWWHQKKKVLTTILDSGLQLPVGYDLFGLMGKTSQIARISSNWNNDSNDWLNFDLVNLTSNYSLNIKIVFRWLYIISIIITLFPALKIVLYLPIHIKSVKKFKTISYYKLKFASSELHGISNILFNNELLISTNTRFN